MARRSAAAVVVAALLGSAACGAASAGVPIRPPVPVSSSTAPTPTPVASAPVLASPVVRVAPLRELVLPDLVVTATRPLTDADRAVVGQVVGVTGMLPVDAGGLALPHGGVLALGVDPSVFRAYTPARTASSDALWQSVARGEALTTYDVAKAQHETLGATVPVGAQPLRLGSFADLQMPGVGAVVDAATGRRLGLVPAAGLFVTAPSRDVVGLRTELAKKLPGTTITLLRPVLPGGHATMGKDLYVAAAKTCPGLSWTVLAAIGGVESGHGANTGVSAAGAEGPMQFLPATFAQYATDGDHDGKTQIDDPADAVYSAAKMLCRNGAGQGGDRLRAAIFAYNHADWYTDAVLQLAAIYARS